MEHHRIAVASLVCMITIGSVMAFLAMSFHTDGPAFRSEFRSGLGQSVNGSQQSDRPDIGKVPTLAPPRHNVQPTEDTTMQMPSFGQTVYVQVEADHAEIEVGWAHSEFLGR